MAAVSVAVVAEAGAAERAAPHDSVAPGPPRAGLPLSFFLPSPPLMMAVEWAERRAELARETARVFYLGMCSRRRERGM